LHISKAELVGYACNGFTQDIWILDLLLVLELSLPKMTIGNALLFVGIVKEVLSIKSRWAILRGVKKCARVRDSCCVV
jgi:hypothetical protein